MGLACLSRPPLLAAGLLARKRISKNSRRGFHAELEGAAESQTRQRRSGASTRAASSRRRSIISISLLSMWSLPNGKMLVQLMRAWTAAAARMSEGQTAQPIESGLRLAAPRPPAIQTGRRFVCGARPQHDARPTLAKRLGMSPARLTISFGFGAGLFVKDGKDRFGLASRRPAALVDMPKFAGDQMVEGHTGGDLAIQVCAEDPQVAFHAVRQLARIAEGVAQIRWAQIGYRPATGERHLLGFSNGKGNPSVDDAEAMEESGVGGKRGRLDARRYLHCGPPYPVCYRTLGPHAAGVPGAGGGRDETSRPCRRVSRARRRAICLKTRIAQTHLRIVSPGAQTILRRSFSYNDGVNFTAERWPPWRQGLEYDAGMFFICYQRDPRTGFIAMYDKMSKYDAMLNQFWTHEGGGLFAYPRGAKTGEYVGQQLFESR